MIFVLLLALTPRLIVPRDIVPSSESPTHGLGFSAILDRLNSILSRVFLKMISAELPVSIFDRFNSILSRVFLATSILWIVNSTTRRSLSLKEMIDVAACYVRHTVS